MTLAPTTVVTRYGGHRHLALGHPMPARQHEGGDAGRHRTLCRSTSAWTIPSWEQHNDHPQGLTIPQMRALPRCPDCIRVVAEQHLQLPDDWQPDPTTRNTHYGVIAFSGDPAGEHPDPGLRGRAPYLEVIAQGPEQHCWDALGRWTAKHPLRKWQEAEVLRRDPVLVAQQYAAVHPEQQPAQQPPQQPGASGWRAAPVSELMVGDVFRSAIDRPVYRITEIHYHAPGLAAIDTEPWRPGIDEPRIKPYYAPRGGTVLRLVTAEPRRPDTPDDEPPACPTCGKPAEVPGDGRWCRTCAGHEGTCAGDHCMRCGNPT